MRQILAVLFTLVLAQGSFAQPNPDTLWTRTYGGIGRDEAYSVQHTDDGGYIVAGWSTSFGVNRGSDFYLVKTNSQGDTIWTRTYGGNLNDFAHSVQQTTDGGYIVAGTTESFGAGDYDFFLVKTDSQGDTLWTRTYGESGHDWAWSAQQTDDEGYIVAGYTLSLGAGLYDFYLVKTDSQRDTLWTRTYGGSNDDVAYSVQQTTDGGYIVAGYSESFDADTADFYLVKTDSQGDTLWTHTYGGSGGDVAYSVQQTTDGGYIVAGYTWSFGAGWGDIYLVKTNSQGDMLWTRTYGGSVEDRAFSVQQTTDGGYIVAGFTWSFGVGHEDIMYLVKTGPDISPAEPLKNPFPADYALYPSWPNPFNPTTIIRYDVRKMGPISLRVFDLLGREVATLVQGTIPAGSYTIAWDGAELPSGIYFCRMEVAGFVQTRKMLLVK